MSLRDDVRYSLGSLRRQPGFAAAAIATLALGIGATTAVFTVVDGLILKSLRYPDAERIVAIQTRWTDSGRVTPRTTGGDLEDLRREHETFDAFSYYHGGEMGVQLDTTAEFVSSYRVDPEFFHVFAIAPVYGRTFQPDDAGRSAVVSLGFAQRHYGAAPDALGRMLRIDGVAYEIVGVMPAWLQFPRLAQVWAADSFVPNNRNRTGYNFYSVAKLKTTVAPPVADAQLLALANRLAAAFPDTNHDRTFMAVPLQEELAAPVKRTLAPLMSAVALVLLIACANVANLTLARATIREREYAVRAAIGASRRALLSQGLTEGFVLAALAAVVGVGLAARGTRAMLDVGARFVPAPLVDGVRVDWRVIGFATCAAVLSALVAAVPAWRATGVHAQAALKHGGPLGVSIGRSSRLRSALIVVQIASSLTLAIDASLLFRTLLALHQANLGYRSEGVLVTYAHMPARTLPEALRAGRVFTDVFAELRRVPGVVAAAGAMGLPSGQYDAYGSFAIEGKQRFDGDPRRLPSAGFRLTSPGYFSTMGIPRLQGRDFNDGDLYERPRVVIVSDTLVRQQFPGEDPIGHRIKCGLDLNPAWMTIVGVVGDVRQNSPAARPTAELYMPLLQFPFHANEVEVVVRTSRDPATLILPVQGTIRHVNSDIAMKSATMTDLISDSVSAERFRSALASTFAVLALFLAVSGMYAVMSYTTARRTAEFGLRSALGARPVQIVTYVLGDASRLAVIGMVGGMALAAATGRLLDAMLIGEGGTKALTYAAVIAVVLPVIVLAAALPAWRASRVDPLAALRTD